jgi:hypothetical protein
MTQSLCGTFSGEVLVRKQTPSSITMYCYLSHIVDESQNAYQIEKNERIARHMRQVTSRPKNEANRDCKEAPRLSLRTRV